MRGPSGSPRVVGALAVGLVALLAFSFLAASGAGAESPAVSPPVSVQSSGSVSATILFNGVNVSGHTTPGTAIRASFSGNFSTVFTWTNSGSGSAPVNVTTGSIAIRFLGASIATDSKTVTGTPSGSITLASNFNQNAYLYEGVYEIHATLAGPSGTLLTQDFYVWVQATDHLTVVNIVLVLIILLEIYQIAALARLPKGARGEATPPNQPPSAQPSEPKSGPEPASTDSPTPPPSGGT